MVSSEQQTSQRILVLEESNLESVDQPKYQLVRIIGQQKTEGESQRWRANNDKTEEEAAVGLGRLRNI